MTVSRRYGSDFRFVIFFNINPKFVLLWKTLQGLKPIKGFVNSSIAMTDEIFVELNQQQSRRIQGI